MTTLIDTSAPHSLVVKAFLEGSNLLQEKIVEKSLPPLEATVYRLPVSEAHRLRAFDDLCTNLAARTRRVSKLLKQVCTCPRVCQCKNPDLTDPPGLGEIHGDCPVHGDQDLDPALFGCKAARHWWE